MPLRPDSVKFVRTTSAVIESSNTEFRIAADSRSGWIVACLLAMIVLAGALFEPMASAQYAIMTGSVSYIQPQNKASGGYLNTLEAVAVDKNGALYIADAYNNRILKEIPNGSGGYTEAVLTSSATSTHGLAVDKNLNVFYCTYISGGGVCSELPYTGSGTTGYGSALTVQTHTAIEYGKGMAVDPSGNLYISDYTLGEILEETPTGSSSAPYATTTEQVIISGSTAISIGLPYGAGSFDSAGNFYIPTYNKGSIVKATPNGSGGFTLSSLITTGLTNPTATYVDAAGNLYVLDQPNGGSRLVEYTGCSTACTQHVIATGVAAGMTGLGVDPSGNLYYPGAYPTAPFTAASVSTNAITKFALGNVNFGNVALGSSATQFVNFVFTANSTLSATAPVSVTTHGVTSTDFVPNPSATVTLFSTTSPYAATAYTPSTCVASAAFTAASGNIYSCTIAVKFTPTQAGVRNASVSLVSSTGAVLGTGFISGVGVAPQVAFLPGRESKVASSTASVPAGISVDASGNVYAAFPTSSLVTKYTYSAGSYAATSIGSNLSSPTSAAVDSYGNVYIVDSSKNAIFIEPYAAGAYGTQTTVTTSALSAPYAVAVDRYGDIFIADTGNNRVLEEVLGFLGTYTENVVATGLGAPAGVAVDLSGNVYISDTQNNRILLETPTSGIFPLSPTYTQSVLTTSFLNSPGALAVDATGDLYIVDVGNGRLIEEQSPSLSSIVESQVSTSALLLPSGVAIGNGGNIYIADGGNNRILEETIATAPTLTFTSQAIIPSGAQFVTFANIGNATLTLTAPSSGTNPSVPTAYSVSTTATNACPSVTTTAATLVAGSSCVLPITFTPPAAGPYNANLTITDNNLAATTPVTQNIALVGTGSPDVETIYWTPATNITSGTTLASLLNAVAEQGTTPITGVFTYMATPSGGSAVAVNTSTVLVPGSYTLTATFTPADLVNYQVQTATSPLSVKLAPVIAWATPSSIPYGTTLAGLLSPTAGYGTPSVPVAGTFVFSAEPTGNANAVVVKNTTMLASGSWTLIATFTPTVNATYGIVTATIPLTVAQIYPTITLVPSVTSQKVNNPVTLTATVSSPVSKPTGTVSFFNGPNYLGTSVLVSGVATYTIAPQPSGLQPILSAGYANLIAVYNSDVNFLSVTSFVVPVQMSDFTISAVQSTASMSPVGQAVYQINFSPVNSATFPGVVTWGVVSSTTTSPDPYNAALVCGSVASQCLPNGAFAVFSPTTTAAGSGATQVTLTVSLVNPYVENRQKPLFGHRGAPMMLCLLLLPFAYALRRVRGRVSARLLSVLILVVLAGSSMLGLSGCGNAITTDASSQYYLTIYAYSGNLSHTVAVNLNIMTH